MNKTFFTLGVLLGIFITSTILAEDKIKVVVTYPYIESIVREIGRDVVIITTLAKGTEDPHFVVPKPSLIGRLRQADILFINGASLEIGFLPPLLKQANNPKINPGSEYFIDLSKTVELINKPYNVSRSEGDVHPEGNPHYYLSYKNLPRIAEGIKNGLIRVRTDKQEFFEANFTDFIRRFEEKKKEWDERLSKIKGCKLIQYHRMFNYVAMDANCSIFAEIEPKPGIPPTAKHIESIIEKSKGQKILKIIGDDYHEIKSVKKLSEETKIPYIILPHDVNSLSEVKDIFSLYDFIVRRLTE
ncbi:MAG: zinc ABC transporter substrate-binding protein [Deltaproteobacteria bacterium]|nr:zinc ABC transporter substrate-binding protein [Deltaproteobacteria bacterium]